MDSVFNAAKKAYRDNFLEYSVTGSEKYKTAYDSALASMKKTIGEMETELGQQHSDMATQQSSDLKNKIQAEYIYEKDLITKSRMMDVPPNVIPVPNMTWNYITVGVLGGILLLVLAM
jgi:hypothetical protein